MKSLIPIGLLNKNISDFRDYAFRPIYEIMKKNKKVFVLTNDMGAKGLDDLKLKYPERVINAGISEQNIASVAGGLAKCGNHVFIYGIISHIIFRSLEQIKIDICIPNLSITKIAVGAGLSYGQDGPTHHGLEDFGIASVLPNLSIYNPSDYTSTYQAVKQCYRDKKPSYIRLDKEKLPSLYNIKDKFKEFSLFGEDTKKLLVGTGITVWTCLKIKENLKNKNISYSVLDIKKLTYFNEKKLVKTLKNITQLIVIDENLESSSILNIFITLKKKFKLKYKITSFNIEKKFLLGSSSRKFVWHKKKISPEAITNKILKQKIL